MFNSFLQNPEYGLIVLSASEFQFYIGDNQQLELIESRECRPEALGVFLFGSLKNVISHRQHHELKDFAHHLLSQPRLARLPVVISGLPRLVEAFARYFTHNFGVIQHPAESFPTLTCPELIQEAWAFRPQVSEIYLAHFQERLKHLMRQGRVSWQQEQIQLYANQGKISKLLLSQHPERGSYHEKLALGIVEEGGEVQIIPANILPAGSQMLAILRGEAHAHTPLLALDA